MKYKRHIWVPTRNLKHLPKLEIRRDIICKEGNSLFQFVFSRHNSLNNRTEEQLCLYMLVSKKKIETHVTHTIFQHTLILHHIWYLFVFCIGSRNPSRCCNTEQFIKSTTNSLSPLQNVVMFLSSWRSGTQNQTQWVLCNILRQCRRKTLLTTEYEKPPQLSFR